MECAQILLDNLRKWPEHVQLISALHKVDPANAYEEIKELAISIEQSKAIYGVRRPPSRVHWKARAEAYDQVTYPDRSGIAREGSREDQNKNARKFTNTTEMDVTQITPN
ncbi:hypothetical protein Aduo_015409 [Ancylostoma duodenale]